MACPRAGSGGRRTTSTLPHYSTSDPYRNLCIASDEEVPRATLGTPPGPAQEGLAPMHGQRICGRCPEVVE
jgi:hypothetical protein